MLSPLRANVTRLRCALLGLENEPVCRRFTSGISFVCSFVCSVGIDRTLTIYQTFFLDAGTSAGTIDSTFLPTLNVHSSRGRKSVNVMPKSVTGDIEEGKREGKCRRWRRAAKKVYGDVGEEAAFEGGLKGRGAWKPWGRPEG